MVSIFIEPKSDIYFKSGLAKSAFHEKIYESLPLDYYLPYITDVQKLFVATTPIRTYPKFYMSHDSFLIFYKPYDIVFQSLKKSNKIAPLWRAVVEKTVKSDDFYELNKITQKSSELSILASVKFLRQILLRTDIEKIQQQMRNVQQSQNQQVDSKIQSAIDELLNEAVDDALSTALKSVSEFKESKESAEEAVSVLAGSGGHGFTKEALSVMKFLEKPEEFRKRVRLLRLAKMFFSKFLTAVPTSLTHQQITSIYGGVNGITRMFSEKQISDILPSELVLTQLGDVGRALLALKIVQKQLMVYQRTASIKPVIFVDKSGSMAESFDNWRRNDTEDVNNPPKISVASGLALALHKKLDADVYLFDTEVEKVNPAKVVDVLLTISADGGTNIDPVLEEIVKIGKQDYIYIIISDGITEASSEVLKKFKESGLVSRTKLILVPPSAGSFNWVKELERYNNVMYARDVVDFENAVKKSLTF
jgi:uncharacterized protein with von Willebrand factor type A (vWA) domain